MKGESIAADLDDALLSLTILPCGQTAFAPAPVQRRDDFRNTQGAQAELCGAGTDPLDLCAAFFLDEALGERG